MRKYFFLLYLQTLYGCLPAILESNPFADDESNTLNVTQITQVFAQARQMMLSFDVNQRISEQLFAYLFFFTNVSLFNTLMEEGKNPASQTNEKRCRCTPLAAVERLKPFLLWSMFHLHKKRYMKLNQSNSAAGTHS